MVEPTMTVDTWEREKYPSLSTFKSSFNIKTNTKRQALTKNTWVWQQQGIKNQFEKFIKSNGSKSISALRELHQALGGSGTFGGSGVAYKSTCNRAAIENASVKW